MRRLLLLTMSLVLLCPDRGQAAVPVEPAVRVLVRVLSYDRNLGARSPGRPLRIGVIFDSSHVLSVEQAAQATAVLQDLAGTRVGSQVLAEPLMLPVEGGDWPGRLDELSAVLICRDVELELAEIVTEARQKAVATLTLEGGLVGQGPALGVVQRQARLEILVDLLSARGVGLDLSAEVLQFAQLVESSP